MRVAHAKRDFTAHPQQVDYLDAYLHYMNDPKPRLVLCEAASLCLLTPAQLISAERCLVQPNWPAL